MPYTAAPGGGARERAHLRELRNFLLRNGWLTIGVPLMVLAATVVLLALAVPRYEASTTLRIDDRQTNVPVLDALKTLSSGSKIETEMEVLASRTLAEDVVDSLGLQLTVASPRGAQRSALLGAVQVSRSAPAGTYTLERRADGRFDVRDERGARLGEATPGQPLRLPGAEVVLAPGAAHQSRIRLQVSEFEPAVKALQDAVSVERPDREADIIEIRDRGNDRDLVREVPNVLVSRFIAWREQNRTTEARSTVRFLHEQIDTLAGQLTGAEDALRSFREADRVIAPEAEAKAEITRLADLQGQRDMVDAERASLARLIAQVDAEPAPAGDQSRYRRLIAFPTLLKNLAASDLLRSLTETEDKRNLLLQRRMPEDPDVQLLTDRIHQIETQLHAVTTTYVQGLSSQVASLDAVLTRFGGELSRIPAREVTYARLDRQAKLLGEIYGMLQTRLKESEIAAAVEDASVRVVDPAILPDRPIWPRRGLSLALALMVGLALGVGMAVTREQLDTTVHTREELQFVTGGLPVLGTIPRIVMANGNGSNGHNGRKGRRSPVEFSSRLVVWREPMGASAEAYRALRTNITFSRPEAAPRSLVFTSPAPGDGKSTTCVNFAAMLAQQELKVLLVDADLRRGLLHKVLEKPQEPGLSNVLLGQVSLDAALQRLDMGVGGRLALLTRGFPPPNPAELLASPRMQALLAQMTAEFDMVIFDAPPLNLVTDAALLGRNVDGVILVARSGVSERGALTFAVEQLAAVRAPALGVVLNDVNPRKDTYYGSYAPAAHYSRLTT